MNYDNYDLVVGLPPYPDSLDDGSDYDDGEDRYLGDGDDEYYHVSEAPSE